MSLTYKVKIKKSKFLKESKYSKHIRAPPFDESVQNHQILRGEYDYGKHF